MASKRKKQVEKLGDVIGRSRPFLGIALLCVGVFLLVAMLHFTAGQEVMLKHYFEPHLPSTESAGYNYCGKLGATLSLSFMMVLGASAYMLPIYVLWFGVRCFRRKAAVMTKSEFVAVVVGVLSLSVLSSVFQNFLGDSAPLQSATFPTGWGGKIGYVVFELAKPLLDIVGSVLLFGVIYLVALVVVFVDSPSEAASELLSMLVWCARMLWRLVKALFVGIFKLPILLFSKIFAKNKDDSEEEVTISEAKPVELVQASDEVESDDGFSIKADELRDLEDFAKELGSAQNSSTFVVEEMVESEQEESVSDFSGVEIDLPKSTIEEDVVETVAKEPSEAPQSDVWAAEKKSNIEDVPLVYSGESEESIVALKKPKVKKNSKYVFPSLNLLAAPQKSDDLPKENYKARMEEIVKVIGDFGVKVIPDKAYPGPVITRYDIRPAPGVKMNRVTSLYQEITAGIMADSIRIISPVPGRGTIGIEVPNVHRQNVSMREVLQSKAWRESEYEIPVAFGKDATGNPVVANMKKMTHLLVAGQTNSGKSVCLNTILVSLLYKMTPEDLRLILIDPKMVEFPKYNSVPHMLIPVVIDAKKAAAALKWLVAEMMRRYSIFHKAGVKNIDGFNAKILKDKDEMRRADEEFAQMSSEERQAALEAAREAKNAQDIDVPDTKMPYIICAIDELADLMDVAGKDVEQYIARLTQLARAAGIHMVIATQRPDAKTVTGKIKNNLPTRIAFSVRSNINSRIILDEGGAESLIGKGDMLFLNNGTTDPIRAQGAFVDDPEIDAIVEALKVNGEPEYAEEVQNAIEASDEESDEIGEGEGGKYGDPMLIKAINIIRTENKASISFLQRKLGIGYNRAANIVEELEARGIVGPDKAGKRELFLENL